MHKQVAKSYDKFYSNEKYYFSMFYLWAQKYKIKSFFTYFKSFKF